MLIHISANPLTARGRVASGEPDLAKAAKALGVTVAALRAIVGPTKEKGWTVRAPQNAARLRKCGEALASIADAIDAGDELAARDAGIKACHAGVVFSERELDAIGIPHRPDPRRDGKVIPILEPSAPDPEKNGSADGRRKRLPKD